MEINEMIARINILARKKRSEGLTEEEQCEQKALVFLLFPLPSAPLSKFSSNVAL